MKFFAPIAVVILAAGLTSCAERKTEDRVTSGAHGPSNPEQAERPDALAPKPPDTDYQTAGLSSEITNGKTDETMEGSGNLAWQGSYEREKRSKMESQAPATPPEPKK